MATYHLPGVTLSQNPYDRMHWAKRNKIKDEWFWSVREACGLGKVKKPKAFHIHIVRVGDRLIDDQNVPAATKPIVDALVFYHHLWSDARRYARITFDQRKVKSGEKPHMEISISTWRPGQQQA